MSCSKYFPSALLVLLSAASGCADDTGGQAAAAMGSSGDSSSGNGVDGGTPPGPSADTSDDSPPSSSDGPGTGPSTTSPPGSTGGTDTSGSDSTGRPGTTDGGSSTAAASSDGASSDGASTGGGSTDSGSTAGGSTDGGSTDSGSTDGGSTDGGSTDGGSTDGGSTDGGSTDGGSTDGGTTDGGTTDGGDPFEGFPAPEAFGDQVTELDLVGTWALPTDGSSPGYSMQLTIAADGAFTWTEYDAVCTPTREANGLLWVNGSALTMLFETFSGHAPWDVQGHLGWDAEAPFLIRAGYAPVLGHIAVTAPPEIRIALPWASRGYTRTVGGATAEDVWVAETELWDIPPGESAATVIARQRHTLDIEAGDAWHTINHWWYVDGEQTADPTEYYLYTYTDDLAGNLTLNGDAYVYVGGAMASYEPGDNFQINVAPACP